MYIWTRDNEFIKFSVHVVFAVKLNFDANPTINAHAHLELKMILNRKCKDVFSLRIHWDLSCEWCSICWWLSCFCLVKVELVFSGILRYSRFSCSFANQTLKFERFQFPSHPIDFSIIVIIIMSITKMK